MGLRAPDIKDEHGWRIHDEEDHLVGYATSRDNARKAARGEIPMAMDLTPAEPGDRNGQPERVEGTVLPPQTPEEMAAATAHEVDQRIQHIYHEMKGLWVRLAAELYVFEQGKMWEALGFETFNAYLSDPDRDFGLRYAMELLGAYKTLVIKRGIDPGRLMQLEVSKVRTVLPAIRREQVDPEQAFADVEVMPRRDLETKYVGQTTSTPGRPDTDSTIRTENEPEWQLCPTCNSRVRRDPRTGEFVR